MKRNATAIWNGTGKEGTGHLSTQSLALHKVQYSSSSRFADGVGTNPEELMAAAHAGCYSMKLAYELNAEGFTPDEIQTRSDVTIENGTITKSELQCTAKIPGIDAARFKEIAEKAKLSCPVSKAYSGFEVTLEA